MIPELKYDKKGLIPAIIQDVQNGDILMMAYMNEKSLQMTLETGFTHFWSRSRQKYWKKGETSGHVFCILLKNAFPINVLNQIKNCPEVCRIFCATANPLEVILASSSQGNGVLGVIDGFSPKGTETAEDKAHRKEFLRKIGYKL